MRKSKLLGILAYLWVLLIVPAFAGRGNQFVEAHYKQGVVLLLLWASIPFVLQIPLFGWILGPTIAAYALFGLVWGVIHASLGHEKMLPIFGKPLQRIFF